MKKLYSIIFCIFFLPSIAIDAQTSHEWLYDREIIAVPALFLGSAIIINVALFLMMDDTDSRQKKNNNTSKNSAKDNGSYQPKMQTVEAISVSRADSHDDFVFDKILQPACRQKGLPRIIIGSIINQTPYNLAVVNVVDGWHFTVLAYKQVRLNDAVVENYKNIVVMGSLFDCLHGNAHIEIVEVNASGSLSQDNGAFLNMCVVSNDVSEGSLDFKFLMAGPNGGCLMSWDRLKNNQCQDVEVQLTLTVNPHDIQKNIFRIIGSYTIVEK